MIKETKSNYWLKSGFLNLASNFSGIFLGFGSFYFLVRVLSKHDFGAWTLFMATTTILELARNGLIQNALIKFISSSEKSKHAEIITASFSIMCITTIICIVLNLSFAHELAEQWKSPVLTNMFYLFNVVFLISGILTQLNCIEQANLSFTGIVITNLIRQGFFFTFVIGCYIFEIRPQLIYLVYVQVIATTVSTTVSFFYTRKFIIFSRSIKINWINKLFNYGKYAFGTSLSSMLSSTIDQMMLGSLLSPSASGSFNIAVRITNLVDIPTNAVAAIVFPKSAQRMASEGKEAIAYLYEKSVGTILAILFPCIIIIYVMSGFVVNFIAGEKFQDAVPLLHITLLYCIFIPFGRQCGTIFDSIGKTRLNFSLVIISAVSNLLLNYFFIKAFGVIGAAYGTLGSTIIGFLLGQYFLKKELHVNTHHTFIYAYRFYAEAYNLLIRDKLLKRK